MQANVDRSAIVLSDLSKGYSSVQERCWYSGPLALSKSSLEGVPDPSKMTANPTAYPGTVHCFGALFRSPERKFESAEIAGTRRRSRVSR
ncbi:hypothetical protein K0M31_012105 [Melipona bicolor]|uniref:Uncharacterized protein n=1 Tax=Melipona bicolor TaxID=60889 RepID=A0AA40KVD1_9HYME|nr:hypothetical protein K0M31_012105 [Melipona bicolor]